MPSGRFVLLDVPMAPGAEIALPPDIGHQVRDVLRLGVGSMVSLLDGRGGEYMAEIVEMDRQHVVVQVSKRTEGEADLPARVVLCQGMLKAAKFEWVLQKGTELGVAAFVPLLCERAVAAAEVTSASKLHRWQRILVEATEQCGGTRLPELSQPRSLAHLLADRPDASIALFAWEGEREQPLRPALLSAIRALGGIGGVAEVRILVGPEGGFSAGEAALAQHHGAIPVTLGRRILRAETAALVATALVLEVVTHADPEESKETKGHGATPS
jgi:16S rRNA (uracil1498-N3)-methyltransferase